VIKTREGSGRERTIGSGEAAGAHVELAGDLPSRMGSPSLPLGRKHENRNEKLQSHCGGMRHLIVPASYNLGRLVQGWARHQMTPREFIALSRTWFVYQPDFLSRFLSHRGEEKARSLRSLTVGEMAEAIVFHFNRFIDSFDRSVEFSALRRFLRVTENFDSFLFIRCLRVGIRRAEWIVALIGGMKSCENRSNCIKLWENCHVLRGLIDSVCSLEANVCRTRDLSGGQTKLRIIRRVGPQGADEMMSLPRE